MAHTDRQTHGHGDSMTDPAQRAESVKIYKYNKISDKFSLKKKIFVLR